VFYQTAHHPHDVPTIDYSHKLMIHQTVMIDRAFIKRYYINSSACSLGLSATSQQYTFLSEQISHQPVVFFS
jgi:hypothetical protein